MNGNRRDVRTERSTRELKRQVNSWRETELRNRVGELFTWPIETEMKKELDMTVQTLGNGEPGRTDVFTNLPWHRLTNSQALWRPGIQEVRMDHWCLYITNTAESIPHYLNWHRTRRKWICWLSMCLRDMRVDLCRSLFPHTERLALLITLVKRVWKYHLERQSSTGFVHKGRGYSFFLQESITPSQTPFD